MEPTTEQLQELKVIEVEMLRIFVDVCNKLGLRYYMLGGTLLGAVRHQGFIPWDDDIDVGMPRADYEVFLKKGQALMPEHLFVQCTKTEPEYLMCYTKIRNSNTTFLESSTSHLPINQGIFIDVFPLDYYPEQGCEQKKIDRKSRHLNARVGQKFKTTQKPSQIVRLKKLIIAMRYPSIKRAIQDRENLYRSVPRSGFLANYGGAWGKKEIVPADWYGEGVPLVFEGIQVMAPAKYHDWLTQVYGDYMQLPPVEKRVSHHYTDVIDLHKSYTEYKK